MLQVLYRLISFLLIGGGISQCFKSPVNKKMINVINGVRLLETNNRQKILYILNFVLL